MAKIRQVSPPTCPNCMGRGTVAETKEAWGADEKGLPTHTKTTTIVGCGRCGGRGTL